MNSDVIQLRRPRPGLSRSCCSRSAPSCCCCSACIFKKREQSAAYTVAAVVLLLGVAALASCWRPAEGVLFNGGFIADDFARYMKVLVLGGSAFALLLSISTAQQNGLDKFEYAVLVMLATLGMMVMVSANDLMFALCRPRAAVAGALRRRRDQPRQRQGDRSRPQVLRPRRAVARACCSTARRWSTASPARPSSTRSPRVIALGDRSIGLIFGMVFLLAGIAFKISAVPFHMWTPDVYEGAPTPVTAFFASAPKVAAMALLVRVVTDSFEPITHDWQQIVIFLSIASMVLAAFAAIGQNNLKRLLAYSSIGHVGFALVGLSARHRGRRRGRRDLHGDLHRHDHRHLRLHPVARAPRPATVETITELAGLAQKRPFVAAIIAILMFSLIGLPPLAGFFAKWHVFLAAIEAQLFVLAVIGVLASAVSAFYYLRIVKDDVLRRAGAASSPRVPRRADRRHGGRRASSSSPISSPSARRSPASPTRRPEACSSDRSLGPSATAAGHRHRAGADASARPTPR